MTSLTREVCEPLGVKPRDAERSKNFFALGLVSWMFTRPTEDTLEWIDKKFAKNEKVRGANRASFLAGFNFGETTEAVGHRYEVRPAKLPPGEYTSVTGNAALAWGIITAGQLAKLPITLGSYPITPASDILHELSKHKHFGVRTVQAEDEIAAIGMALGASFAGHLGVTTTSGPGIALKSETTSLAVSIELPLLIVDIQRGGPSTGLPTKTEASDLNIALFGRHGESPVPVVAAYSPTHCFYAAIEAIRIALTYRTPVYLLSDGYLANGSEPWLLPDVSTLPDITVPFATEFNHVEKDGTEVFWPYLRDPDTLARPWAIPGTPDLMHRVGGLEKSDGSGNIDYTPENHERMVRLRGGEDRRDRQGHPADRAQRRSRRRRARARLGVDVGGDRRRGAASAPRRTQGRIGPPRPPQPVATGSRRPPPPVPPDHRSRAQHRPADQRHPRPLPRRRPRVDEGAGPAVQVPRDRASDRRGTRRIRRRRSTVMSTTEVPITTKADWSSDQEVRWCPGCGDYGILLATQQLMPELGVAPKDTVFVSGIGCSSRFPYYMNTYGMHSIHGRAPAIATGIAVARPDLDVWVITGDGDGLSIGGNHLIHALRRNVNLTILLFNNRIYGLTKGQFSPTSELGKVTKSTPFGSIDPPFNPLMVALGAEATFVARTHDLDRKHMIETFRAAHDHHGASFVEIYQNCNVFNDGQFDGVTKKQVRDEMLIDLVDGEPIVFGAERQRGVVMGSDGQLRLVELSDVDPGDVLVHDAHRDDPSLAFALARLSTDDHSPTPFGVFRDIQRQEYSGAVADQVLEASDRRGPGDLEALLRTNGTWTV